MKMAELGTDTSCHQVCMHDPPQLAFICIKINEVVVLVKDFGYYRYSWCTSDRKYCKFRDRMVTITLRSSSDLGKQLIRTLPSVMAYGP